MEWGVIRQAFSRRWALFAQFTLSNIKDSSSNSHLTPSSYYTIGMAPSKTQNKSHTALKNADLLKHAEGGWVLTDKDREELLFTD